MSIHAWSIVFRPHLHGAACEDDDTCVCAVYPGPDTVRGLDPALCYDVSGTERSMLLPCATWTPFSEALVAAVQAVGAAWPGGDHVPFDDFGAELVGLEATARLSSDFEFGRSVIRPRLGQDDQELYDALARLLRLAAGTGVVLFDWIPAH